MSDFAQFFREPQAMNDADEKWLKIALSRIHHLASDPRYSESERLERIARLAQLFREPQTKEVQDDRS
jgi:hypothetical protein